MLLLLLYFLCENIGKGKATDWEMDASARKIQGFYRKHKGQQQTQAVKPGLELVCVEKNLASDLDKSNFYTVSDCGK